MMTGRWITVAGIAAVLLLAVALTLGLTAFSAPDEVAEPPVSTDPLFVSDAVPVELTVIDIADVYLTSDTFSATSEINNDEDDASGDSLTADSQVSETASNVMHLNASRFVQSEDGSYLMLDYETGAVLLVFDGLERDQFLSYTDEYGNAQVAVIKNTAIHSNGWACALTSDYQVPAWGCLTEINPDAWSYAEWIWDHDENPDAWIVGNAYAWNLNPPADETHLSDNEIAIRADGTVWQWGRNTWHDNCTVPPQKGCGNTIDANGTVWQGCGSAPLYNNDSDDEQVYTWDDNGNIAPYMQSRVIVRTDDGSYMWEESGETVTAKELATVFTYNGNPVTIDGIVTAVMIGEAHLLAMCEDGTAWAWGANAESVDIAYSESYYCDLCAADCDEAHLNEAHRYEAHLNGTCWYDTCPYETHLSGAHHNASSQNGSRQGNANQQNTHHKGKHR